MSSLFVMIAPESTAPFAIEESRLGIRRGKLVARHSCHGFME
jgi:hypothetical protein